MISKVLFRPELMKRFDPNVLTKTFEDYNTNVRTKRDPFGKKVSQLFFISILFELLLF